MFPERGDSASCDAPGCRRLDSSSPISRLPAASAPVIESARVSSAAVSRGSRSPTSSAEDVGSPPVGQSDADSPPCDSERSTPSSPRVTETRSASPRVAETRTPSPLVAGTPSAVSVRSVVSRSALSGSGPSPIPRGTSVRASADSPPPMVAVGEAELTGGDLARSPKRQNSSLYDRVRNKLCRSLSSSAVPPTAVSAPTSARSDCLPTRKLIWVCPHCTLDNPSSAGFCAACEAPRPEAVRRPVSDITPVSVQAALARFVAPRAVGGSGSDSLHRFSSHLAGERAADPSVGRQSLDGDFQYLPGQAAAPAAEPAQWRCARCTYINAAGAARCALCTAAAAAGAAVPPPVPPSADWTCSRCTLVNAATARRCAACRSRPSTAATTPTPASAPPTAAPAPAAAADAGWACPTCTYGNAPEDGRCGMCGAPRAGGTRSESDAGSSASRTESELESDLRTWEEQGARQTWRRIVDFCQQVGAREWVGGGGGGVTCSLPTAAYCSDDIWLALTHYLLFSLKTGDHNEMCLLFSAQL